MILQHFHLLFSLVQILLAEQITGHVPWNAIIVIKVHSMKAKRKESCLDR